MEVFYLKKQHKIKFETKLILRHHPKVIYKSVWGIFPNWLIIIYHYYFIFPEEKTSASRLLALIELTNQTVGDALSDALLVETVLKAKGWNLQDWEKTYTDLPNRLLKVAVKVLGFNSSSKGLSKRTHA